MKSLTLALIGLALPRAMAHPTFSQVKYTDTKGELIGYVDNDIFYLNRHYSHYKQARGVLVEQGVDVERL